MSACTITTVDTTPDGGATGGSSGSGGSAGTGGAAGSGGVTADSGADTGADSSADSGATGGTAGAAGAAGSGGASGSAGAAGTGGSAGVDGGADTGTGGAAGSSDGGPGGSAGAAGSGMTDGGAPDGLGDPCDPESMTNDDRDHSTPYTLGAATKACLQSASDVDFYQFTLPSTPVQGGYVTIQLTDVGTTGNVSYTVYAVHDNGEVMGNSNATQGGSVFGAFAGKAGATFRVKVERYVTVASPTPYTLTMTFTGVNDINEPNDDNAHATQLTLGTPASGYFFAGYEDGTAPADTVWDDRFKVTVPEGESTFTLNVPPAIDGEIIIYDANGSRLDGNSDATNGATIVLKHTFTSNEAGVCYVSVHPYVNAQLQTTSSTPLGFWTTPYTLTVTGP